MPLSHAMLLAVVEQLPSPVSAQPIRMPVILEDANQDSELYKSICECDRRTGAPVIGYISKIIGVPKKELPQAKIKRAQLSAAEQKERRERYLASLQQKQQDRESEPEIEQLKTEDLEQEEEETLIGFARLYSGTVKVGDKIYLLGPKYDPKNPSAHCTQITVENLYLLMGRELMLLDSVPAGNVFGISGLNNAGILKTATLSSTPECPSFGSLKLNAAPIVRVAVEPKDPSLLTLIQVKCLNWFMVFACSTNQIHVSKYWSRKRVSMSS